MVKNIQDHIGSLNWNYRTSLRDKGVKYINAFGEFESPNTLKVSVLNFRLKYNLSL